MRIEIYQAKDLPNEINFIFRRFDLATELIKDFVQTWRQYYNFIYEYDYDGDKNKADYIILDDVFTRFNLNHPDDFRGHSLSVSDIVLLDDKVYYCDPYGWQLVE